MGSRSVGTGTAIIDAAFYNFSTVDAQSGTLDLEDGGAGAGLFEAETEATLEFGGGTYTVAGGGVISGAGTSVWSGGTEANWSSNPPQEPVR